MGCVVRHRDWKWLRTASLEHEGFLPGMPWEACDSAFKRLQGAGLVARHTYVNPPLSKDRAIITDAGREALRVKGQKFLKQTQATAITPPCDESDIEGGR